MANSKKDDSQKKPPTGKQIDGLNPKERRVLSVLIENGGVMLLSDMALHSFGSLAPRTPRTLVAPNYFRANSWTRNSLRNLVSEGYAINLETKPSSYKPGVVPAGLRRSLAGK